MHTLEIRPLSVNRAHKGRRFKTPECLRYERDVLWCLKDCKERHESFVYIEVYFYIKNFLKADENNFLKIFIDLLVKAEIIKDDRFVVAHYSQKFKVKTEIEEMIEFEIKDVKKEDIDTSLLNSAYCLHYVNDVIK